MSLFVLRELEYSHWWLFIGSFLFLEVYFPFIIIFTTVINSRFWWRSDRRYITGCISCIPLLLLNVFGQIATFWEVQKEFFFPQLSLCSPIWGLGTSDCRYFPEPFLEIFLKILASNIRLTFPVVRWELFPLALWPHVGLFDIWLRRICGMVAGMGKSKWWEKNLCKCHIFSHRLHVDYCGIKLEQIFSSLQGNRLDHSCPRTRSHRVFCSVKKQYFPQYQELKFYVYFDNKFRPCNYTSYWIKSMWHQPLFDVLLTLHHELTLY